MPKVDDWMTVAAWAATHNMTRQAGHAAVRRCGIARREGDGRVSRVEADALYLAKTRPYAKKSAKAESAAAPAPDGEHVTYQEAKRREAVARALLAEREAATQAGELVLTAQVRQVWARMLSDCRSRLLALPDRLAPQVCAVPQAEAHRLIFDEVCQALEELSSTDGVHRRGEVPQP
ncbi:MAG: hypothetical protein ACLGIT_11590 [Gammaproteobacteria bacterium]